MNQNETYLDSRGEFFTNFPLTEGNNAENQHQIKVLTDIRDKFRKWQLYIYTCVASYLVLFFTSKAIISWVKPYAKKYFVNDWATLIVAIILAVCFIADSRATSYLKNTLQRLAFGIEKSFLSEKTKDRLLTATQDTNELFKTTFQRFGLTALPVLLVGIIDNGVTQVINEEGKIIGQVVKPTGRKSESLLFHVCYLLPVLLATWKIWQIDKLLRQIEADFHSNQTNA